MKLTFMHVQIGKGFATLAINLDSIDTGLLEVGVAFCAPQDQFCRKSGRVKAGGRVQGHAKRNVMFVPFKKEDGGRIKDTVHQFFFENYLEEASAQVPWLKDTAEFHFIVR